MTAGSEDAPLNSSPSPAEVLCWIWSKNYHQDSTEEELRKESMNVVKEAKSEDKTTETIEEGSGVEVQQQETKKSVAEVKKPAKDEPKVEEEKPVAKKAKKEKKSKKRSKKPKSAEKKSSEVVEKSTPKSVEAEEQIGGDKVLRFVDESTPESKVEAKPEVKPAEEPKPQQKSTEDASLLDEDEERVRELAKFQNKKAGKCLNWF